MLKAFYSSATGMRAQELLIDNTANNLANVNTTAFKRSHINFADLMYEVQPAPGALSATGQVAPIGTQIGNGTRAVGTTKVNTMGVLTETGIDTHLAIEGDGFFKVTFPNGDIRYTRDGNFTLNDQRQLVTADGLLVEPAITIPIEAESFTISPDGAVSFLQNGASTIAGQIQLFRFPNPAGLENKGNNLYALTGASGAELAGNPRDLGFGALRQRFVEGSNVEVVSELVSLITAQRAYEINSRAIRAGDEMLSNTGQLVR
ncbi:MAG: flagellar basal-body rod protein FlgG [Planctomycetota bacterium]|jgi:flagellar basal-body rod protein FlgG|nr:flagellar basal-body rod protein FlgG [Blastopirellula sp.]